MIMIDYGTLLQMCSNFFLAVIVLLSATALYHTFMLRFVDSDRIWEWVIKLIPFFLAIKAWQFVDYAVVTYRWKTHGSLNTVQEWMLTLAIFSLLAFMICIFCLIYHVFQFFFSKTTPKNTALEEVGKFGGLTLVFSVLAIIFSNLMVFLK